MSDERIKPFATSNNSLAPGLSYVGNKIREKFEGQSLKQDRVIFTHGKIVNIYIVYEINLWDRGYADYPILENSLFAAVRLVKNANIEKYKYSGYGYGFDRRGTVLVANELGKNVMIFGVDMGSFVYVDIKKKDILNLGEGPTQWLDDITLTAKKKYSISFTESWITFCFSLHYNRTNSYLFVNSTETHKFKEKNSEMNVMPLRLGNNSKECSVDNMKTTGLIGYV